MRRASCPTTRARRSSIARSANGRRRSDNKFDREFRVNAEGRLAGRVAIVTGAAQGIGASYARALAAEGAAVMVADLLDGASVAQAIFAAGGKAARVRVNVTDAASVQHMVAETVRQFGGLDI